MKILHISSAMGWRGGESQLIQLFNALQKQRIIQSIYCPDDSALANYCTQHYLPFLTYKRRGGFNIIAAIKLKRYCQDNNSFDLIHLHDSNAHTLGYLAYLFGLTTPMVLSRKVVFKIKKSFFTHKKYNSACIKRIVCVSHAVQKIVSGAVADQSKIKIVYEGIQPIDPNIDRHYNLSEQIGNKQFDYIIGYIAALTAEKDHETFLLTAAKLLQSGLNIGFVLAGTGNLHSILQARITALNLQDHIFLIGFCEDVPGLMQSLDIILFTPRMEGLSITIMEAFFMNVPVVATEAGGISELIKDQQTGMLAKKADVNALAAKTMDLLLNAPLRKNIIEAAYQFVQCFSSDVMAMNMIAVYKEALQ